jgi:hypothetical protein
MLQASLTIYVAVGQVEMLSRDLKKVGDGGFLPTAKLWHNVLLAKFAGTILAENVVFGSRRYETLCIELCESHQNRYAMWPWTNVHPRDDKSSKRSPGRGGSLFLVLISAPNPGRGPRRSNIDNRFDDVAPTFTGEGSVCYGRQ